MTYKDFNGKMVNKPKEIFIDSDLYDTELMIKRELCRQVNSGIIRCPEKMKTILEFAQAVKT